jgi:hypothetical protein
MENGTSMIQLYPYPMIIPPVMPESHPQNAHHS